MGLIDRIKSDPRKKRFFIILAVLLLLALLIYFYTYFFTKKGERVIYQDATRRIYLTEKKEYIQKPSNKKREMWRMVYEDNKSGNRFFVMGNSVKGFPEKKMAQIVINTVDQNKMKSFDLVQSAGVTIAKGKTDIHSNLNEKKDVVDFSLDELNGFAPKTI